MKKSYAKPFLKWAGGKTQLIAEIEKSLPQTVLSGKFTYVEPFVGSGAIFFWMLSNFPNLEKAIINDINSDLINAYKIIASEPKSLISILKEFQAQYHALENREVEKKEYYYEKREQYNTRNADKITHAALFIFLNRTCFNGLYRVNSRNLFNVPMGSYKSPRICDEQNILAVSESLKNVEIQNGDFETTLDYANENSVFYLDPPYKPLSATSNFNSYAENVFDDNEQLRLRDFCIKLHAKNIKWILSNSDVQDNNFFDELFEGFLIKKVNARRLINSKVDKRGKLNELLISNFKNDSFKLLTV